MVICNTLLCGLSLIIKSPYCSFLGYVLLCSGNSVHSFDRVNTDLLFMLNCPDWSDPMDQFQQNFWLGVGQFFLVNLIFPAYFNVNYDRFQY